MEWKNLRNERIRFAYECVCYVRGKLDDKEQKKFRAAVRGYEASVHRQSFLQDLSGRISKIDDDSNRKLVINLLTWLLRGRTVNGDSIITEHGREDLQDERSFVLKLYRIMLNATEESLLYYTQEACKLVNEIKKYAEAELPSEEE